MVEKVKEAAKMRVEMMKKKKKRRKRKKKRSLKILSRGLRRVSTLSMSYTIGTCYSPTPSCCIGFAKTQKWAILSVRSGISVLWN